MTSDQDPRRALLARILREKLGPQVRALAKNRISLTQLARNVGYSSFGGLDKVLQGESDPPLSVLLALAATFDLHSIEELFGEPGTCQTLKGFPIERP